METKLIERWDKHKLGLRKHLSTLLSNDGWYDEISYDTIIEALIKNVFYEIMSSNYTKIDDGDYQGTIVYVVPEDSYQPSDYYITKISYGSCSACDTLESIKSSVNSTEVRLNDYMTLALHIVQEFKLV